MSGQLIGIARKAKRGAPVEEIDTVQVTLASGLDGDKRGTMKTKQVSILALEDWTAALGELGEDVDLPWTTRRANLLTQGVDLPQQAGALITIGPILLEVTSETDPCEVMERAHKGLRKALEPDWRGGVRCRVLEGGIITIGDTVKIIT